MSVKQRPILNPLWVFERQVGTVALAPSEPLELRTTARARVVG